MKSLSPREIRILAAIALLVLLLLAGLLISNLFLLGKVGVGGEFLLPWKAARAFLFERVEPYSSTVSGFVQQQVYGRTARAGEKPYILDLPFYLLMLYFPLGLFTAATVAGALWLMLCQLGLLTFVLLSVRLTDWQPRRSFLIAFFLLSALSVYAVSGLLENAPVLLLGLIYAGILLALRAKMDELAGALIALAFYRWEVGSLFLFFVFLRIFDEQRWRVLAGFSMVTGLLVTISFFVYPDWLFPFLRAVLASLRADYGFSPATTFTRLWPNLGGRLGWALTAILTVILVIEWSAARRAEFRRFYWAVCLTLAATPLFGFRTEIENLVILILPSALIFSVVRERWKAGYWLATLLLILIFAFPWGLFFGPVLTRQVRSDILYLFLPVFSVVGLYWIKWWALRPPRTWLERAANAEYG